MASKIKGITIEIGGNTQPLQEAIKKVDSTAKNLKTELSSINRLLKFDPSNVTLLTQKQEVLARSIQATEEKVQKLKLAQKQAKGQLANGDIGEEQYRALEREVISAEGALNNLKKQAQSVEEALENAGKESAEAAVGVNRFSESTQNASEESQEFSQKAKAAYAAAAVAITAAFAAVKTGVSFLMNASEETREFSKSIAILEQNAKNAGASINSTVDDLRELTAITGETDSAVEGLSNLLQAGFTNNKLTEAVNLLSGAVVKFPDTLKIESLADSLQETLATGSAVGQYSELLERLGENLDEFNEGLDDCTNQAEKQDYALSVLARNGLGYVADQYAEANKELLDYERAQFKYNETLAGLGDAMRPINTAFENAKTTILQGFLPSVERVGNVIGEKLANKNTQEKLEQIGEGIGVATEKIADFALVVIENGDAVVGVLTSIGAGVAAWKVSSVIGNAIASFQDFAKTAKKSGAGVVGAIKNIDKASMSTIIGTIVAVVGVLSTLVTEAGKASDEITALKDTAETLKKDSADLANEFERTNQAFIINSQKATALAEDIEQLNKKIESGSLSSEDMAKAQAKLTKNVAEYNAIVEGAALTIDEETGAIQGGTAALKANTKELIANARATAYVELYAEAVKGATQAEIEREAALSALRGEMGRATAIQQGLIAAVIESGGKQEDLTALWYNASIVSDSFNGSIMAGVEAIENANAAYDKNSATLRMIESSAADAGISLDKTTEVIEESGEVVVETTEKIRQMTNDEITWLNNLVDAATDTNNEIVLSEQKSFEDRKKILDKNKEVVADFVENRNYLMNQVSRESQFVLSEMTINDARTLKDMVELWKNGGQDQVNAYIESLLDVFGEEAPIFAGAVVSQTEDAIEAGKEVASQQAGTVGERMASAIVEKYDEGGEKIENTAKTQIRDVFKEINSQVTQLQFATIGNRIGKDIAEGLRESYSIIDSAASSVARRIRNRLNFNVSVNGATKIPGAASGAIVSQEQIIRVAERGPEAIIPLDKLGAIMQSAINGRGQVSFSPVINFNATKVSDAEAMRLARIVSREFARATGGRMG